ncbi:MULTISPECIES: YhgE/Pip domain-containing protein [unclassified Actinopolyspora]|uniref:YhgE/Pip family protein n=1 Tax=unclassified Actinopolyspora TaxID=2639451 RepID=UPI0013F658FB|nr:MULTISPECIES: YhgE/Pip domain-containing protein [unclassified Actinopolyspora]NHD18368.1 YhgE/Pip domain-containing protein [Actinopolyspora sp. BKK2]NHE76953.1 YhgE/Pip domain-containing protein [Actinopolyspora sp. BKK1]
MRVVKLALLELRRFRGGKLRPLVLVALVLVPLLYGSLYLWSNWNPYGRTEHVPVAVVNNDQPVRASGQFIDAGKQFTEQLRSRRLFDWNFVDAREARRGLRQGDYYFTITVPKDFSAKLGSATHRLPQRAELEITKNDANGYIAGIMADTVEAELQNQINAAAHSAYARTLYDEMDTMRQKLLNASKAAEQLVEGTSLSVRGTEGLSSGLSGAVDGARDISTGVDDISTAAAQLDRRLTALTNLTADRLPARMDDAVDAGGAVVQGMSTVATATSFIADRASNDVAGLEELGRKHPELGQDPTYRRVLRNARQLAGTTAKTNDRASEVLSEARRANSELATLRRSVDTVQQRITAVTEPADRVTAGTSALSSGAETLTSSLNNLSSSSRTLNAGAQQLNSGAEELKSLVDQGLSRIPPTDPARVSRAADVLGSPTAITQQNLNPAHVYGRGLAPFFFAIALWVFGLFAYLLLKPVNTRAMAGRNLAATIALAGWLPAAVLGTLGAGVLLAVVGFGLGLDPIHLWPTVGLLALGATAFVAIDHLLRTAFGAVGDAVSLVLLIVQLTASGGLYPMETTPVPFQAIHPYLPMTYLVDGLRVTISGGLTEHLVRDLIVLGGFLLASLVLTTIVVARQRVWTIGRLHPRIEL